LAATALGFEFYTQSYPYRSYEVYQPEGPAICIAATGSTSGPLDLEPCQPGQQSELWYGPPWL
jgi:hypothetical protein